MDWIENGYRLLWSVAPPPAKEMANAPSALEHSAFVSAAVSEMLAAGAVTLLPPGEKPWVVSPLGVVPKPRTDKFRLTVNMRFVNRHLGKKAFKFEGLKDLADLAERGDHAVSYDLTSGYYHVGLHPRSRTYVGFKWQGRYYVYNCLPFGLSTAPWVFSKVMRELVMYWRREGIKVLPYLDDFMFMKHGFLQCASLARRVEGDFIRAGLKINVPKCHSVPAQQRRQLGFDVDFEDGKFRVPEDRFEALRISVDRILSARHRRVQARKLASVTGTVLSMHLSWGPVTQLYTRHLYALIDTVVSLNCWVVLTEEAENELLFWQGLSRLRFEGDIWPPTGGVSVRMASDASDFGWGGHTMQGAPEYAREYFSAEECVESSTYRELLGVFRCVKSMLHLCAGKFVVFQVDARNLLGIVNRGSPRLKLNELARELFWFGVEHGISLSVKWVPREENSLADELSKLAIPDDYMLSRMVFRQLEERWGRHSIDLFASGANN